MSRLRIKPTYSNVISTLCLFLLIGGGTAYAASQLPKNSVGSKQLKNEAVTPEKLSKAAKASLTGPAGPQGPAGVQGVKGDRGEKGESPDSTLPSGQSESGFYASGSGGGASGYIAQGITFRRPLAQKIPEGNAEWLKEGQTSPSCPAVGTAAPGHLCLYDNEEIYVNLCCIYDGELNDLAAGKDGFIVYWVPTAGGAYVSGEYTVTAP